MNMKYTKYRFIVEGGFLVPSHYSQNDQLSSFTYHLERHTKEMPRISVMENIKITRINIEEKGEEGKGEEEK